MAFPSRLKFLDGALPRKSVAFFACVVFSIILSTRLVPVLAVDAGDPVKGQALFAKNSCVVCHAGGENNMDPAHPIKGAAFQQKYKDDLILENTIRKGFPQYGMPSFSKTMVSDHDMKDLIAYVRTFSKAAKNSK